MTAETPTSTRPPAADSRLRASDAEREEIAAQLHRALGEGRLTLTEIEERVTATYAAHYRDELAPLVADVPQGSSSSAGAAAPDWAELWRSAVWWARATLLGAAGAPPPTPAQCRTATLLTALAVLWTVLWAFVGARLVH